MKSDARLLLPEGARLIHIGPHKTGSTAIQVSLHKAREELTRHGVYYAGSEARPRKAGWAIGLRGLPEGAERPSMLHWEELAREVESAGNQRVAISNEDFGRAKKPQLRQIVDDLGGERVHVVAVARRLDRYLPSQWQERVKAGDPTPYDEWLRAVLARGSEEFSWDRRNVWHSHDIEKLVHRWVDYLGQDRFTLIVSDESDRSALPRTFEAMLGLPTDTLQLHPDESNRGLTWEETELVRALNEAAVTLSWTTQQRRRYLKHAIVPDLQARAASQTGPRTPPLPAWAVEEVREISEKRAASIRALGVRVVGDPDAMLVPDDIEVGSESTTLVQPATAAAAVAAAIRVGMAQEQAFEEARDRAGPERRSLLGRARGRTWRALGSRPTV